MRLLINTGGPVCRPYGRDVVNPGGASGRPRPTKGVGLGPAPAAEFGQKTAGAQCAPLQERGREPAPSSAPFGGTFPYPLCPFGTSPLDKGSRPPGGRLRKNKKGQVWDLSLKTQRRSGASHKISLPPITINLDRKAGQPVRLSFHLVPKLQ